MGYYRDATEMTEAGTLVPGSCKAMSVVRYVFSLAHFSILLHITANTSCTSGIC